MGADLRHAFRTFARSRTVLALSVLCLGLGIGVVTMVFSVVNGVLLRPVPFRDPAGLLEITVASRPGGVPAAVSTRDYDAWRREPLPAELAAIRPVTVTAAGQGETKRLPALAVTANTLALLGVDPRAGQSFRAGDDGPSADAVVLIGEALWRSAFGADAAVVGTPIEVNGRSATVIGVVPTVAHPGLPAAWRAAQVWLPLDLAADDRSLTVLARAPDGADRSEAAAALAARLTAITAADPATRDSRVRVAPFDLSVSPTTRAMLMTSTGAAIVVLLIGCANVASLLLLHSTSRQREIATRLALGASHGRIARQLMLESALLALASVPPGLLLGWIGRTWLLGASPEPVDAMVPIDARVVLAATAAAIVTSVLCGLVPAMQARRASARGLLADGGRQATTGRSTHRLRFAFATSEIVLSVVLIVSASLLARSFANLLEADRDLDLARIMVVGLGSPEERRQLPQETAAAIEEIQARAATVPGVLSTAVADFMPLRRSGPAVEVRRVDDAPAAPARAIRRNGVSAGFFETMGIAFDAGRPFTASEARAAEPVVVVNRRLADLLWPRQDAVGKRIRLDGSPAVLAVVGVARNISNWDVSGRPLPTAYLPLTNPPASARVLVVRTTSEATSALAGVRDVVASVDRVGRGDPLVLETVSRDAFSRQRTLAALFGAFTALSLLLTAIGLYGVLSYFVSQRRRELGIRAALGAGRRDLIRLVGRQCAAIVGAGGAIGLLFALGATRMLRNLLFEVGTTDPISFNLTAVVILLVAVIASWAPARRAASTDPTISLRIAE
jgi:predicted permease